MKNSKLERGSGSIIAVIVLILVVGAGTYFYTQQTIPTTDTDEITKSTETSLDTVTTDNETSMSDYDYSAQLSDVTGGDASGTAYYNYTEGNYNLYATFENLPELDEGYFYEGWVVRKNPLEPISTGSLEEQDEVWINEFASIKDLTNHNQYVLTLEPDDGDPAPADHVVEGSFVKGMN